MIIKIIISLLILRESRFIILKKNENPSSSWIKIISLGVWMLLSSFNLSVAFLLLAIPLLWDYCNTLRAYILVHNAFKKYGETELKSYIVYFTIELILAVSVVVLNFI